MSDYNLKAANEAFIKTAAYLARDLDWDDETPITERKVERWRESVMRIIAQHKSAHERIRELEAEAKDNGTALNNALLTLKSAQQKIEKLEAKCAEHEKWQNNLVQLMVGDCTEHTGENTPDFATFREKYTGCAVCRVNKIEELERDKATLVKDYNQLFYKVQELEAKVPRWISVKEQLPPENTQFLGWWAGDIDHYARVEGGAVWNQNTCNMCRDDFWECVTHWIPILEAPDAVDK